MVRVVVACLALGLACVAFAPVAAARCIPANCQLSDLPNEVLQEVEACLAELGQASPGGRGLYRPSVDLTADGVCVTTECASVDGCVNCVMRIVRPNQ